MNDRNFHARMMNIPIDESLLPPAKVRDPAWDSGYRIGHRYARHAAAEIASEADAEIRRLVRLLDEERRTVAKMGHRLDEAHEERDILREQVSSLRADIGRYEAGIDNLAAAEVRAAKEESARLAADLRRQEMCAEKAIRRLQSDFHRMRERREEALEEVARLTALTKAAPVTTASDRQRFARAIEEARGWLRQHDGGEWRGWSCAVLTGTQEVSSPGWYALPPGQWCGEPHILIERAELDGMELPTVAESVATMGVPVKVEE